MVTITIHKLVIFRDAKMNLALTGKATAPASCSVTKKTCRHREKLMCLVHINLLPLYL